MGTGSSSSWAAKPRSPTAEPLIVAPGPDIGGGNSSGAPARQGQEEQRALGTGRTSGADAGGDCCDQDSAQGGEPDADLELLNQILQECDEGLVAQPPPPRSRRLPPRFDSGDSRCPPAPAGGSSAEEVFLAGSTQGLENSNFSNQLPLKKPEKQAKISYDYSEEELMATIEQEYCR